MFIRLIPTFIKDFALKFFALNGQKGQTSVLSNLGVITLPSEYEKYVDSFTAISSTPEIQLTICSYRNKLVLAFSSHFISKDIERYYLKNIQQEINSDITIISNIQGDDL